MFERRMQHKRLADALAYCSTPFTWNFQDKEQKGARKLLVWRNMGL
jgi:hypothetical protein